MICARVICATGVFMSTTPRGDGDAGRDRGRSECGGDAQPAAIRRRHRRLAQLVEPRHELAPTRAKVQRDDRRLSRAQRRRLERAMDELELRLGFALGHLGGRRR